MGYKRKLQKEEEQICVAYSDQNQTLREIAKFHKVSPGTIRNVLVRHGVNMRTRGRKQSQGLR